MDLDEFEADVSKVRRCELDPSPHQETETVQMWQQQQVVVTFALPLNPFRGPGATSASTSASPVQVKKLRRLRMSPLNV